MAKLTKWAIFLRAFLATMLASSALAQEEGLDDEAAEWSQVVRSGTAEAYFLYLRRYPRGIDVPDAMRALENLEAAPGSPDIVDTEFQLY